MPDARTRLMIGVALAACIAAATLVLSQNFRPDFEHERAPYGGDFLHEWTGGYIVRAGDVARLYDPRYADALQHDATLVGFHLRHDGFLPLVYPPIYYAAVSPFGALPYRAAAWAWAAFTLACFVATVLLLGGAASSSGTLGRLFASTGPADGRLRRTASIVTLPAAVTFLPFAENLVGGQKGTAILLVLALTWLALQRGHDVAAGLVFGVLAVKPQLAFVVPIALLAKGAWRFVLGVALTTLLLVAGSLAMGIDVARSYVDLVQTLPEQIRLGHGQLHRTHGVYGFFTLLAGAPTPAVRIATIATAVVLLVPIARLLRSALDVRSPRFAIQYAGLVVATILLAPNVVTYDLTILLLPLFLLGWLLVRGAVPPRDRRMVLWIVVAVYAVCGVSPSIAQRTGVQLTFPLLAALLLVLARLAADMESTVARVQREAAR